MNLSITEMASFAVHILKNYPVGSVHSVYRKTINLNMGIYLVSLQAESSPLSPISLITSLTTAEMNALTIHPGDPVTVHGQTLTIFSDDVLTTFTLVNVAVFESFVPNCFSDISMYGIEQAIRLSESGGISELFFAKKQKASSDFGKEAFLSIARNRISDADSFLSICNYEEACRTLIRMLGLGIGLTPSGDDFLCGVLAGLLFCGKWNHPFSRLLRQELSHHLCDTNDISRAFLSCSLSQHFSRPVKELPSCKDVHTVLSSFGQIGHSSGLDSLCGIYFILRHFHKHP